MAVVMDKAGRSREVRWGARRKAAVVRRVQAGEPIEPVAAEVGVEAAVLVLWCERYDAAGTEALKGYHPRRGGDR